VVGPFLGPCASGSYMHQAALFYHGYAALIGYAAKRAVKANIKFGNCHTMNRPTTKVERLLFTTSLAA
jgi:hypothetical protein